jgi:hypothetical protein
VVDQPVDEQPIEMQQGELLLLLGHHEEGLWI